MIVPGEERSVGVFGDGGVMMIGVLIPGREMIDVVRPKPESKMKPKRADARKDGHPARRRRRSPRRTSGILAWMDNTTYIVPRRSSE